MNYWRYISSIFLVVYMITISVSVGANETPSVANIADRDDLFESTKKVYNEGNASSEDLFAAQKQFELACENEDFKSCYYLAKILIEASKADENRNRKPRYISIALNNLEKACEAGVVKACAELGYNLYGGYLGKKDESRATLASRWACDQGDAFGCRVLGFHISDSTGSDDLKKSLYEKSCRIGGINGSSACYYIAKNYQSGVNGLSVDLNQATKYYMRACDQGDPNGCKSAGEIIQSGNLSELFGQRRAKALIWFEKACDAGRRDICEKLGKPHPELTRSKNGCENNDLYFCHQYATKFLTGIRSINILEKNCQLGYSDSCVWLGKSLQIISKQEAHNYLKTACDDGHGRGCYFLGKYYLESKVVLKDIIKTQKYFELACNVYEVEFACRALSRLPYQD